MSFNELLTPDDPNLIYYSPYNFLKDLDSVSLVRETVVEKILSDLIKRELKVEEVTIDGLNCYFITRFLKWDTDYFGRNIYRIELVLRERNDIGFLNAAIKEFVNSRLKTNEYYYAIIPSEDLTLIQSLTSVGFKMVETRLNYYLSGISSIDLPRYQVRRAGISDIDALKSVASRMRNRFDRVHADSLFSQDLADRYLETFIEKSVEGFADMVLVPSTNDSKPFGFLAANKPVNVLNYKIAKLVLAAVDSTYEKGWLLKLLFEVVNELKAYSTDYLTTITQSANRPAIRTWEKAGFRLGFTTHVFSINK